MPWWFRTIYWALLVCFTTGLTFGLLWGWWRRRALSIELERARLDGEAESDRLRLRLSSLKASEDRAVELDEELLLVKKKAGARLTELERELASARAAIEKSPAPKQQQVVDLRKRARSAEKLERELSVMRSRSDRADKLEAENVDLRGRLERVDDADPVVERLRASNRGREMAEAELRSVRLDLEDARVRAAQLEIDLATVRSANDDLTGRAVRAEELELIVDQLSGRVVAVERLEAELETARADSAATVALRARVKELEAKLVTVGAEADQIHSLRSDLDQAMAAESEVKRLTVDLDRVQADLGAAKADNGQLLAEVDALRTEIDVLRADAMGAAALDLELQGLPAESAPQVVAVVDAESALEVVAVVDAGPALEVVAVVDAGPALEVVAVVDAEPALEGVGAGEGGWVSGVTALGTPGADHDDDLKAIRGIGPAIERSLNSLGIRTWEQVAALSAEDIVTVSAAIKTFPGRIERDDWVGGAMALLAQGHDPLPDSTPEPDD